MNQNVASRHAFMVSVTGSFNVEGFQELTRRLNAKGTVKNLFFSGQSDTMDAAATFFVQTDERALQLKADLQSVPGVTNIQVEHNDDTK